MDRDANWAKAGNLLHKAAFSSPTVLPSGSGIRIWLPPKMSRAIPKANMLISMLKILLLAAPHNRQQVVLHLQAAAGKGENKCIKSGLKWAITGISYFFNKILTLFQHRQTLPAQAGTNF